MFEHVDRLLEASASPLAVKRLHRVELLEARRRRAAGLPLDDDLIADETRVAVNEMAVPGLLARVRAAYDGPLLLMKGPEVALAYGAPGLRSFGDLDFLTDDAEAAQAALIAAGFQEVFDPAIYEDIHHLQPLWWPGLPLVIEIHSRANWPAAIPGPSTEELLASAVPSGLGVPGITTLPPEHHTLILAAHAWEHQQLNRLGNLVDVAAMLQRTDEAEVARLARRWGCARMWRTTRKVVRAVVDGKGRSLAVFAVGRHLSDVRERTVLETHIKDLLAPSLGLPPRAALRATTHELRETLSPVRDEPWRAKLSRVWLALRHAGVARSEHDLVLESQGQSTSIFKETE